MPNYMLLIYTPVERPPADDPGLDISRWIEFQHGLEEAGVLVGHNRLSGTDAATTVRLRTAYRASQ